MSLRRLRPLLPLLILLSPLRAGALERTQTVGRARLEIRSTSAAATLSLSDTLTAVVTVEAGPGLDVERFPGLPVGSPWQLLRRDRPEAVDGEHARWRQTYVLAPVTRGQLPLEFPPLRYRDTSHDWQTVTWTPFTIEVTSQITTPDAAQLRDIPSVEDPPTTQAPEAHAWLILLIAGVPLGLAAAWYAWVRRRRQVVRKPRGRDPLREWQRLMARKLPERGRASTFVTLLSLVLRRHVERCTGIRARRQTTAELLPTLAANNRITTEQAQFLVQYLAHSDLVKYAGITPSLAECHELAEAVRQFIEQTIA